MRVHLLLTAFFVSCVHIEIPNRLAVGWHHAGTCANMVGCVNDVNLNAVVGGT